METHLLLYDVEGRGLVLPAGWELSRAGDRRWLARGRLLIPLPASMRYPPARLSTTELDALRRAIPGARSRNPDVPLTPPRAEAVR